jgi:hypothetical protein
LLARGGSALVAELAQHRVGHDGFQPGADLCAQLIVRIFGQAGLAVQALLVVGEQSG